MNQYLLKLKEAQCLGGHFNLKKRMLFFIVLSSLIGLNSADALNIEIEGPSTVCPINDSSHTFTANPTILGIDVNCSTYSLDCF